MMNRTTVALVLAFVTVVESSAHADLAGHVEAQFFGGRASVRDTCQQLVSTQPSSRLAKASSLQPAVAQIMDCLQLIRGALAPPTAATFASIQHDVPGLSLHGARHRQLLSTYRAIQQLKPWVTWSARHQGDASSVAELIALDADARAALNAHSLLGGKYTAVLRGALGRADPGGYVGEPSNAPNQGFTAVDVDLDVETEHVDLGRSWDFGLVFDAGTQPLFVMVKTPAATMVTPAYLDGLTTSTGFRFAHASTSTETAVVGRIGAARLNSESTVFGGGNQAESAVVAANDMGEWALFMEGSVDFRWYARDVWLVHLATQPLDPLVHIYAGVKHDQRYHRAGDLEGFDDPTGRIFFGFDVNPIRVTDRRTEGSGNTLFTFGGGFAFEGALRETNRLPSGFRVGLSGNLDLVKVLHRLRDDVDSDR